MQDIFGYVVEFSSDQHGSRFIQQKLETASEEDKQVVFDEIVPHNALHLIQGVFGNYVSSRPISIAAADIDHTIGRAGCPEAL